MDVEHLIGTMIEGALTGGRKRSHGARRFLRGGRGSSFLNASTLLTVGGLVWGAIETMQQQRSAGGTSAPPAGPLPPVRGAVAEGAGRNAPPPQGATAVPPLPGQPERAATPPDGVTTVTEAIPEGAARLVSLMVSAARADGNLTEDEQATILEHARAAGAERLVADEIARPTPLARIVDGITDAQQRADLYVLAYGIVRADEAVSGAEQIYLAQLAALLGLDQREVERLERDASARIDASADQGQS